LYWRDPAYSQERAYIRRPNPFCATSEVPLESPEVLLSMFV
jgi:hypothetical protein